MISDTAQDERFASNPIVLNEPNIRFYAGAVLHGPTKQPVGTICIIDKIPREFGDKQLKRFIQFAHLIEDELGFTHHLNEIRNKVESALYYDTQSGIPNRRLLKERLDQLLQANPGQPLAIFALKINQLKKLENSFGVEAPKLIIAEVNGRLLSILSKSAVVSRWEDDLFVILVHVNTPEKELFTKLKKVLGIFEIPFFIS